MAPRVANQPRLVPYTRPRVSLTRCIHSLNVATTTENLEPGVALRRALVFGSVVYAGMIYGGATNIANAVLPQMQGDLSASLDQISWVVTASVVAGAIGTPPTPWLAARFGAKQLFIASLIGFTASSAMIGLSNTLTEVVI